MSCIYCRNRIYIYDEDSYDTEIVKTCHKCPQCGEFIFYSNLERRFSTVLRRFDETGYLNNKELKAAPFTSSQNEGEAPHPNLEIRFRMVQDRLDELKDFFKCKEQFHLRLFAID